jgi:hypothetical protein
MIVEYKPASGRSETIFLKAMLERLLFPKADAFTPAKLQFSGSAFG